MRNDLNELNSSDLKQSLEWFKQAVARIKSLNLPPCPKNYTIWYEYYSGRNQALCNDLNSRLEKAERFDQQLTDMLYHQYFSEGAQDKLSEIRSAIRALIDQLASELNQFGVGIDGYQKVLNNCVDQISDDMDVQALRLMVDFLLTETKNCRSANLKAVESVSKTSQEIDSMREVLKQLSEEALEDPLTGVFNRRALEKELNDLLTDRADDQLDCLLMLDVDHFKNVNDEFGHVVGDRVLRFIAEMIKRAVKGQDFVARFGGEEFAVILPNTGYRGGMSIAETILKRVSSRRLTVERSGQSSERVTLGKVTLSAGLCRVTEGEDVETLIGRADALLYKAKKSGRNKVVGERD